MERWKHPTAALVAAILLALPFALADALEETTSSPDITLTLDPNTLLVQDEDAVIEIGGVPELSLLGSLPEAAALAAYHLLENEDQLFALDITVSLSGGVLAEPRDVVRFDAALTHSIELDGSDRGIPEGAKIDALTAEPGGDLLLSFDISVRLPGAGGDVTADDEDLVRFDASTDTFSIFFDGSAAQLASGIDLDAAHLVAGTGHLLLSFDVSGSVGGVTFDDEDVLEHDPNAGTWELRVDSGARDPDWLAADLDAFHLIAGVCGDVNDDQDVNRSDGSALRSFLADPLGSPLSPGGQSKCSVIGGATDCDILDAVILRRSFPTPPRHPGIAAVCSAVLP